MSGEGNDDPEFMRGFLGGLDFAERLDTDEKQEQRLLTPYASKGSKRPLRALAGWDRGEGEPEPPRSNIGPIKGPVRKAPVAGFGYRPGMLGEIVSGRGIPLGSGIHLAPPVKKPPAFRIIPRHSWAKHPPNLAKMDRYKGAYTGIILHHTGDEATPRQVEDLHTGRIAWYEAEVRKVLNRYYESGDVGYNYFIDPDGTIYEGRSLSYEPAHTFGHNPGNIGIAFLGDYSGQALSNEARSAGVELMRRIRDEHRMGKGGEDFISTHAQHSSEKKDELKGAMKQIEEIKRQLRRKIP